MSDTGEQAGAVGRAIERTAHLANLKLGPAVPFFIRAQLLDFARAHDAEDARRQSALDAVHEAWTNSDVHPRHTPKTCDDCDCVYDAVLGAQEVGR